MEDGKGIFINYFKSVTIIGGGTVGLELAKSFEKTPIKTKLIEKDYKRCEFCPKI